MTEESYEDATKKHAQHMAERDKLTDAARESSRTFDQAVLAFGAAVFGASVAFLKDVAPKLFPALVVRIVVLFHHWAIGRDSVILIQPQGVPCEN
jgi:hypothetical protein